MFAVSYSLKNIFNKVLCMLFVCADIVSNMLCKYAHVEAWGWWGVILDCSPWSSLNWHIWLAIACQGFFCLCSTSTRACHHHAFLSTAVLGICCLQHHQKKKHLPHLRASWSLAHYRCEEMICAPGFPGAKGWNVLFWRCMGLRSHGFVLTFLSLFSLVIDLRKIYSLKTKV